MSFEMKKSRLKALAEQMLSNVEIPAMIAPILQVTLTTQLEKLTDEKQIDDMIHHAKSLIHFVETGEIDGEESTDYHTTE